MFKSLLDKNPTVATFEQHPVLLKGNNPWFSYVSKVALGTIQVLRHHVFDFFRPTHLFDDVILHWSLRQLWKNKKIPYKMAQCINQCFSYYTKFWEQILAVLLKYISYKKWLQTKSILYMVRKKKDKGIPNHL